MEKMRKVSLRKSFSSAAAETTLMSHVDGTDLFKQDEKILADSFDFGEWASIRQSRIESMRSRAYTGGPFNNGCMAWIYYVVRYGWKHVLLPSDLPGLYEEVESTAFVPKLEAVLKKRESPDMNFKSLLWCIPEIRRTLVLGSIVSGVHGLTATVARPLVLKLVIQTVESGNLDALTSIGLLCVFGAVVFFEGWIGVHGRQLLGEDFASLFQNAASSLVYKKMLRINTQKTYEDTSSETSLIGNDVVRAYENIRTAQNLPMAITGVVGGVIVLGLLVGVSSIVGLTIMFLILGVNVLIGRKTHGVEQKNLRYADERLGTLARVLEGIKAVKFFGWERQFMETLDRIRQVELSYIRQYRLLHVSSIASGRGSPVLSSMATLIFYSLTGNVLTIADAYATISVFQALRLALIMVPLGVTSLLAFDVTMKRLTEYLQREEKGEPRRLYDTTETVLRMSRCDIGWPLGGLNAEKDILLHDVSLRVPPGCVVAVVGRVGCGKSSLLSTAVQAISPIGPGEVFTAASLGYAPQKPFVVCGSIKQNILLGRPFDQQVFDEVLARSGLDKDLESLPNGHLSEIGERGTTLSGGQQARLGVARAMYGLPELLVYDDPLSAVDPKVAAHMFQECVVHPVRSAKTSKACLVALNQIDVLPQVDRIVFLQGDGFVAEGSYGELVASNAEFLNFVSSFQDGAEEEAQETVHREEAKLLASSSHAETEAGVVADITRSEDRAHGAVSLGVYKAYVKDMGVLFFVGCVALCLAGYVIMSLNDFWLSVWAGARGENNGFYAGVYAGMSLAFALLILAASYMMCFGGVNASESIHRKMMEKLLNAPMQWFESTSSGRVLSRFSGDLARVDMILSLMVDNTIQIFCNLSVLLAFIIVAVPFMALFVALTVVLYGFLLIAVDRTARSVKRIANNALSPLLSNAAEAVRGRDLILSMECTAFFEARHRLATDEYTKASFMSGSLINFGYLVSHFLSFFIAVSSATMLLFLGERFVDSDLLGLSLTYAFLVPYFGSIMTQILIRTNSFFTALERLLNYESLPQEISSFDVGNNGEGPDPPLEDWPTSGAIVFRDVQMRYRPELPLVLRGVSFSIPAGVTVGVCGRTGSGKSSCISALFRLVELSGGEILIDGRNIASISLETLRSRLTIIPQDPILMEGVVRTNLDPFHEYSSEELQDALNAVGLRGKVSLEDKVESGGRNWSCGERQLLCFARAFLRRHSKVVVMDEPTSSIDMNTDELIQNMVKVQFKGKTILCIAHRLNTICDYDMVMVMKDGVVAELDAPYKLIDRPESEFSRMIASLGSKSQRKLIAKASSQLDD